MTTSNRFNRIAQILFTSTIDEVDKQHAKQAVEDLSTLSSDFNYWIDTIENNVDVLKHYKEQNGDEKSLVVINEKFNDKQEKQKENYENIIKKLKKIIEDTESFKDIEMQEMISNLAKISEEYTKLYNEVINLQQKIGEEGFLDDFLAVSQKVLNDKDNLIEMFERVKTYIQKNILDEQSLT